MSTILDALQKQDNNYSAHEEKKTDHMPWKMALLTALMVIISLLGTLLYMQFNNVEKTTNTQGNLNEPSLLKPINEGGVVVQESEYIEVATLKATTLEATKLKPVKRMTFDTQPLPEYEKQVAVSPQLTTDDQIVMNIDDEKNIVRATPDNNDEIDYSDVSSELKQRFERALENGEQQGQQALIDSMGSSSDIHQMSTDFQKKVPPIRYDSHMYSSLAENRWIRINGETLKEGEFDSLNDIELVEIMPNRSVFRFGLQSFTLESLVDWQGY